MNRADRRSRTDRIVNRRNSEWFAIGYRTPPPKPGRAKDRSHFDCGLTGCEVCSKRKTKPQLPLKKILEEQ